MRKKLSGQMYLTMAKTVPLDIIRYRCLIFAKTLLRSWLKGVEGERREKEVKEIAVDVSKAVRFGIPSPGMLCLT